MRPVVRTRYAPHDRNAQRHPRGAQTGMPARATGGDQAPIGATAARDNIVLEHWGHAGPNRTALPCCSHERARCEIMADAGDLHANGRAAWPRKKCAEHAEEADHGRLSLCLAGLDARTGHGFSAWTRWAGQLISTFGQLLGHQPKQQRRHCDTSTVPVRGETRPPSST